MHPEVKSKSGQYFKNSSIDQASDMEGMLNWPRNYGISALRLLNEQNSR